MGSPPGSWWAASKLENCWRYELAGDAAAMPSREWLKTQIGDAGSDAQWIEYHDDAAGSYRAAVLVAGRLEICLMLERTARLPARAWLIEQFGKMQIGAAERGSLLRGRPAQGNYDPGPTICACFSVGANQILDAIKAGCSSVQEVGKLLRAGSNCGSCRPEISRMVAVRSARPLAVSAGPPSCT